MKKHCSRKLKNGHKNESILCEEWKEMGKPADTYSQMASGRHIKLIGFFLLVVVDFNGLRLHYCHGLIDFSISNEIILCVCVLHFCFLSLIGFLCVWCVYSSQSNIVCAYIYFVLASTKRIILIFICHSFYSNLPLLLLWTGEKEYTKRIITLFRVCVCVVVMWQTGKSKNIFFYCP